MPVLKSLPIDRRGAAAIGFAIDSSNEVASRTIKSVSTKIMLSCSMQTDIRVAGVSCQQPVLVQ